MSRINDMAMTIEELRNVRLVIRDYHIINRQGRIRKVKTACSEFNKFHWKFHNCLLTLLSSHIPYLVFLVSGTC